MCQKGTVLPVGYDSGLENTFPNSVALQLLCNSGNCRTAYCYTSTEAIYGYDCEEQRQLIKTRAKCHKHQVSLLIYFIKKHKLEDGIEVGVANYVLKKWGSEISVFLDPNV